MAARCFETKTAEPQTLRGDGAAQVNTSVVYELDATGVLQVVVRKPDATQRRMGGNMGVDGDTD
eukprot:gene9242-5341_t